MYRTQGREHRNSQQGQEKCRLYDPVQQLLKALLRSVSTAEDKNKAYSIGPLDMYLGQGGFVQGREHMDVYYKEIKFAYHNMHCSLYYNA